MKKLLHDEGSQAVVQTFSTHRHSLIIHLRSLTRKQGFGMTEVFISDGFNPLKRSQ